MGKDLKGKELGTGLIQEKSGLYVARFVDRLGKRQSKRFRRDFLKKLTVKAMKTSTDSYRRQDSVPVNLSDLNGRMLILRHTFATRCIEAGMKPKTIQIILGHSNIGITMNLYVHTTEDEKMKEMESVAEALKVV